MSKFGWKGDVEDFRGRWANRIEAYDWALTNLMPNRTKQVVFPSRIDNPSFDYAVAGKGFVFWLDTDAGFGGLQNGGTDFRFYSGGDDLLIRAVRVRRVEP